MKKIISSFPKLKKLVIIKKGRKVDLRLKNLEEDKIDLLNALWDYDKPLGGKYLQV